MIKLDAMSINALAQEFWDGLMADSPTWAHMLGDLDNVGAFESATADSEDASIARLRDLLARVTEIAPEGLSDDERITREVVRHEAGTRAQMLSAGFTSHAADPIFGLQKMLPVMAGMLGIPDQRVADAMTDKLAGVGRYFSELAERQREGAGAGRNAPQFAVHQCIEQLDAWLATPIADDPLTQAFTVAEGIDLDGMREQWGRAVDEHVRPGLAAYRDVLTEIAGSSRGDDEVGLCFLPQGEALYDATLRFFTTTDKSAAQIHQIGLDKVAELAEEYLALAPEALGLSGLDEIFEAMRTDPDLHFTQGQQLVEQSEVAMARAWAQMADWFEVLPQAPCTVTGTTSGAKAFYFPPAQDGSRGGSFFINTEQPESWGTFELEAMAFHEGIPGHHLQLAIAAELPDTVPAIRRFSENAAYAEGWGLYAERLADEMGLYSTPVDRLGMLSADSMRACRLVVDTGIHAFGWSRSQAVDYMVANSPLRRDMCQPEVDRYIVSPGQACSYMVGRIEIERMRADAETALGEDFDVKVFHSAVLDSGALPLGVLDTVVRRRLHP